MPLLRGDIAIYWNNHNINETCIDFDAYKLYRPPNYIVVLIIYTSSLVNFVSLDFYISGKQSNPDKQLMLRFSRLK